MKTKPLNQWSFFKDGVVWEGTTYPTKEEAIQAGKDKFDTEEFQVGDISEVEFTQDDCESLLIVDMLIRNLAEILNREAGGIYEYWVGQIKENDKRNLNNLIAKATIKWIDQVGQPKGYKVDNTEIINPPPETSEE